MTDKYILRVTAGSDYDVDKHVIVPVNSPEVVKISNNFIDAELNVRVQNYHGLPRNSAETSPYFSQPPHDRNRDQYSISFRFTPKASSPDAQARARAKGKAGIGGEDLQFGNDFDRPIRDRLPPGFNTAMSIVKWWIDPGLDGDVYAEKPFLYGPALSSFNVVHAGEGEHEAGKGGLCFAEGGDEAGLEARRAIGAPDSAAARMKWALNKASRESWLFEAGRTYGLDFFNPYLNFNDFSLRLPGFTLPIMKYWDGQGLRYVLRNKATGHVYLVVLFTLYLKEDVNEDGSIKPAALAGKRPADKLAEHQPVEGEGEDEEDHDHDKILDEAQKKFKEMGVQKHELDTSPDDVD